MRKVMSLVAGSLLALGGAAVAAPAQAHESGQDTSRSVSVKHGPHHPGHKTGHKHAKWHKWHGEKENRWAGNWWQDRDDWYDTWSDWHEKWHDEHDDDSAGTPGDDGTAETPGGDNGSAETPDDEVVETS
ncbi:hypothetical protein ACFQ36_01310 [Arthrobacter sp. GCM10027362]|uniref:hypothetical protein n=1 Tax=Arthrobacter sp. GCM10027362 TaxID=3273379 RepID=UPI003645D9CE